MQMQKCYKSHVYGPVRDTRTLIYKIHYYTKNAPQKKLRIRYMKAD